MKQRLWLTLRLTSALGAKKVRRDLQLAERIKKEARRSISMTRLGEKTALRLVVLAPAVTGKSLLETVEYARELALEYTSSPPGTPAPG